jgi:DNA repair protein RadD
MTELRPYQREVIEQLNAARERRLMLVAPTGAGKTVIAADIIQGAADDHVVFLAHRRELIHQTRDHLAAFDVPAGIVLAGEPVDYMRRVQVASIQTLHSRCIRGSQDLPPANVVFVDESHHAPAQSYRAIIDAYPDAKIIGMTATPCRRDGCGLGSIFQRLIECPQVPELIKLGFLVPTKVFAPTAPDLRGVHTRLGDYVEGELADAMDQPKLVGDVVSHWHRLAGGRKTVVFATSVAHSRHLCEEFIKSGVRAEHIDGSTDKDERDEILKRLSQGDLDLVSNCMVLTEGWDQPDVACCVLARPTKSMGLYRQMVGRVIRPSPGKDHALILDHAGATLLHGFVEDRVGWTLDPDERADNHTHQRRDRENRESHGGLLTCSQCSAVRMPGKACPNCGFLSKRPGEYVVVRDGDLAHLDRSGLHAQQYSAEQKHEFHAMLAHIAKERGYKPGWAAYKFKEKFGHWPLSRFVLPMKPNAEVIAWERHLRIKYAKSLAARQAAHA